MADTFEIQKRWITKGSRESERKIQKGRDIMENKDIYCIVHDFDISIRVL